MTLAMACLRRFDDRMVTLQRQGRISFWGPTTGEEASVIGSVAALQAGDWIVPALRQSTGALRWRGYALELIVAQTFGVASDPMHGRQMPCHPMSKALNLVSWSPCIGNQIPHGVGIAYAMKQNATHDVCMTYMGDGATSEADFHCAMTFAGVWKVPCVLVCQNNQWAISVPVERQSNEPEIWKKAQAYGFEGVRIDGNDIEAVYAGCQKAVAKARAGDGPTLVELLTYRASAHSTSDDPSVYRDEVANKKWFAKNDPLPRAIVRCEEEKLLTQREVDAATLAFDRELEQVIKKIEGTPSPLRDKIFSDVYADQPWNLKEQEEEMRHADV